MRLSERIMAGAVACVLTLTMLTACGGGGGGGNGGGSASGSGSSSQTTDSSSQTTDSSSQTTDSSSQSTDSSSQPGSSSSQPESSSSQSTTTYVSAAVYNNSKAVQLANSLAGGIGTVDCEIDGYEIFLVSNGEKAVYAVGSEDENSAYGFFIEGNKNYIIYMVNDGDVVLDIEDGIAIEIDEAKYTIDDCAEIMQGVVVVPDRDIVLSIESGTYTYGGTVYDSETFTIEEDGEISTVIYCFDKDSGELKYLLDPDSGEFMKYSKCSTETYTTALNAFSNYTKMTYEEYEEYVASQE